MNIKKYIMAGLFLSPLVLTNADDIDIITSELPKDSNILFVMDVSGSMGWSLTQNFVLPIAPNPTRQVVLQQALSTVLNDPTLTGVNVGISSFSGNNGGGSTANGIAYPVSPIDAQAATILNQNPNFTHTAATSFLPMPSGRTSRGYIGTAVPSTWISASGTPLVAAFYEAALYFRGAGVDTGNFVPTNQNSSHPASYSGLITAAGSNINYISPINNQCSSNSIVLLSDGRPNSETHSAAVATLIGPTFSNGCATLATGGRCGPELATFLATTDQSTSAAGNNIAGNQTIKTHTIGLALNATNNGVIDPVPAQYLRSIAAAGDGEFLNANTANQLATALTNTLKFVKRARSFSSPTYTTTGSSLYHDDFAYYPVFERKIGSSWAGNLKKYKRSGGNLVDRSGDIIHNATGGLKNDAEDFWSSSASTDAVDSGGAANMIDPNSRRNGIALTDDGNLGTAASFIPLNTDLPNSVFNTTTADSTSNDKKGSLIDFIHGYESDGSTFRNHMGDIIHSKPILVSYGASSKVVFVGTNEGYLHAIDENTGAELYSFMPRELLKNIKGQLDGVSSPNHTYGVDGEMTVYHDDANNNRIIDAGETAMLYFGLRRGGKSYYAIDISSKNSPSLAWKISNTGDFNRLGFTWSKPVLAKIKGQEVLIFGGGYIDDNGQFGAIETDGSTTTGSDVFIVNALTGAKIWSLSGSGVTGLALQFAKPAKIRAIDVNRNGSVDRLYYSDTGGNIWRVDLKATSPTVLESKVMQLASLGGGALTGRKFFTEPDVAIFKHEGKYVASIAIGSGDRTDPLSIGSDLFFTLFDENILVTPTTTPVAIVMSDLMNATDGPVNPLSSNKKGWYLNLQELTGEKVISDALTYQNMVLFSSFGTGPVSQDPCIQDESNRSRLYVVDLLTGGPKLDLDGTTGLDTSIPSANGQIPSKPQIVVSAPVSSDGGDCTGSSCIRPREIPALPGSTIDLPPVDELRKMYWIDENLN